MSRLTIIAIFALILGPAIARVEHTALAQTEANVEEIHNELRALKDRVTVATNNQDMQALAHDIAPDAILTTMTNDVLRGPDELEAYFANLFTGPSRLIDSMTVSAEADELSRLYADDQIAVATGNINAHFKLTVGKEFDWPIRWSAVLIQQNGKWLISNAHFSANAIDNPITSAAKGIFAWLPWATALLGLIVGFVLARLTRRRGT